MSQVDVDSGIENMEVEDSDRREKRNLTDKVNCSSEHYSTKMPFNPVLLDFDHAHIEIKEVSQIIKGVFGYLQKCIPRDFPYTPFLVSIYFYFTSLREIVTTR